MKKLIMAGVLVVGLAMITKEVEALDFVDIGKKVQIFPTSTPVPTPTSAFKVGKLIPLVSIRLLATATPTIQPTNTPAPATATPTITATTVMASPTVESKATTTPMAEPTVTSEAAEPGSEKTQIFTMATIGLLGLIVLVQAWPKIKSWMHQKTE